MDPEGYSVGKELEHLYQMFENAKAAEARGYQEFINYPGVVFFC